MRTTKKVASILVMVVFLVSMLLSMTAYAEPATGGTTTLEETTESPAPEILDTESDALLPATDSVATDESPDSLSPQNGRSNTTFDGTVTGGRLTGSPQSPVNYFKGSSENPAPLTATFAPAEGQSPIGADNVTWTVTDTSNTPNSSVTLRPTGSSSTPSFSNDTEKNESTTTLPGSYLGTLDAGVYTIVCSVNRSANSTTDASAVSGSLTWKLTVYSFGPASGNSTLYGPAKGEVNLQVAWLPSDPANAHYSWNQSASTDSKSHNASFPDTDGQPSTYTCAATVGNVSVETVFTLNSGVPASLSPVREAATDVLPTQSGGTGQFSETINVTAVNPTARTLAVTYIQGAKYTWTSRQNIQGAVGTTQTSNEVGNRITLPTQAGSYTYTVSVANTTAPVDSITVNVIVCGSNLDLTIPSQTPNASGEYTVTAGARTDVTASWTPGISAPGRNDGVVYRWSVAGDATLGQAQPSTTPLTSLNTSTAIFLTGPGAEQVAVSVSPTAKTQITLSCSVYAPGVTLTNDESPTVDGTSLTASSSASIKLNPVVLQPTVADTNLTGVLYQTLNESVPVSWSGAAPTVTWVMTASGANAVNAPAVTAVSSGNNIVFTTSAPLPSAGTFTYGLQAKSGEHSIGDSIEMTLVVGAPKTTQKVYVSAGIPVADPAPPGWQYDSARAIVGQSDNLPVFEVDAASSTGGSWSFAWGKTSTMIPISSLENDPSSFDTLTSLNNATNSYQVTASDTAGATPTYFYCRATYSSGASTGWSTVKYFAFTLNLIPDGNQTLEARNSQTKTAKEIPAVVNSSMPVSLSTLWMPNVAPANARYNWELSSVTPSGGTVVVTGPGRVGEKATWSTSTTSTTLSNFSAKGLYTIQCTPATASRADTTPVSFTVNVGDVSTAPASGIKYWIQPAGGAFTDSLTASDFGAGNMLPTADVVPNTTLGQYTIGSIEGDQVMGATPAGPSAPVEVNGRFQLYFDPSTLEYESVQLSSDPSSQNYWGNYVSLQWVYRPSGSASGSSNALNIPSDMGFSGVNSTLLTSGPLTAEMEGWQFAVEIHSVSNGSVYTMSDWALLRLNDMNPSVLPTPTLTSYPKASGSYVQVTRGADVTFTANVQDSIPASSLSYQWQTRPAPTAASPNPSWTDIQGATSQTYAIEDVALSLSGASYRCSVVTTSYASGIVVQSNTLTLQVSEQNGSIVFSAPTAATLVNLRAGRTITAEVDARTDNGDGVSRQWYVKSYQGAIPTGNQAVTTVSEAAAYIAASGSSPVSGETDATFTSQPLSEGIYEFTCRVTNSSNAARSANSEPVYVVVAQNSRIPHVITPASQIQASGGTPQAAITNVGVTNGQALTLECDAWVASGEELRYNWETASSPSGPWSTLTATGPRLTLTDVASMYTGAYYRCIVSNDAIERSVASGVYHVNVWNVANVPTIIQSPLNVGNIVWNGSIPNGAVTLTCTARVSQGASHSNLQPTWTLPNGALVAGKIPPDSGSSGPSATNEWKTENGTTTYTSTLTIPVPAGAAQAARAANGNYSCTWFNPQGSELSLPNGQASLLADSGTALLAPQATSGTAEVNILVPGNPRLLTKSDSPVTAAVGKTATFSVGAILNETGTESPRGTLVYVWQMTDDGGATWNNCLREDGTGQFSSEFTTQALTEEMYDNSTASNVAGAGTEGAIGNAKTVYMYRCIISNRTTGYKIMSDPFQLIVTPGSGDTPQPPPEENPTIEPGSGSDYTISGTGDDRDLIGPTVTRAGTTLSAFYRELDYDAPEGYVIRMLGADDEEVNDSDTVATGMKLQLVRVVDGAEEEIIESLTVIVMGDVRGTGVLNITQIVAMAKDVTGDETLSGPYFVAGDFNDNNRIDISDLMREAKLLTGEETR